MRRSLLVLLILMICFVGTLFAQTDGNTRPAPTPIATLSPRGMEGIFQTLRVNYGVDLDNTSESFPPHDEVSAFIAGFSFKYLDFLTYMPYAARINIGFMGYDQYDRLLATVSERATIGLHQYLGDTYADHSVMAWVGLNKEGFGMVYTDKCAGPSCNTVAEQAARFRQDAVGVFVTYVADAALNKDEERDLILKTYPRLETSDMVPFGEGFMVGPKTFRNEYGVDIPLMYYVGTVPLERRTAVYAVVAVGEEAKALVIPES